MALKTNTFKIVGTLVGTDLKEKTSSKTGSQFITGSITVESIIGGQKNEYSIDLFANKMTKDNTVSKLYETYSDLVNLVGKKIEVNGSLTEDRFYSSRNNLMVSRQGLSGRFIKGVTNTTEDCGTFTVSGFVVSGLTEKTRKDGSVYAYELALGQANYREDGMIALRFQVKPEDVNVVKGIQNNYKAGDTVTLSGDLHFLVETVTQTFENAFGAPTVKTFENRYNSFFITGGSNVLTGDDAYSKELVSTLVDSYKAKDTEIKAAADEYQKSNASARVAEPTPATPKVSTRQVSLI